MELKRVVVTGLGAISPLGNTLAETWEGLINGRSGAGPITQFDASKFKTQIACEVKNFDPSLYVDRKEARKCDRYSLLAIGAAKQAVADAAMDLDHEDKNRIGVIFAAGIGGIKTFEEEVMGYVKTKDTIGPKFNPFFIPKMIADIAAGHISMIYGFHGPNFATVSACASSTNAIADAFNYIRLGKANAIVTGGAEAAISVAGVGGFNSMNALSTRNDSPETASRPFSASRDGFVMGEGAACLVLEEMEHALARGAKIYAEVVGAVFADIQRNDNLYQFRRLNTYFNNFEVEPQPSVRAVYRFITCKRHDEQNSEHKQQENGIICEQSISGAKSSDSDNRACGQPYKLHSKIVSSVGMIACGI